MAIQNMERDAPWTAWSKMPQLHKESALQGRVAQPKRTFGTKVPAYEDAAVSYSTFCFQLSALLPPPPPCVQEKQSREYKHEEREKLTAC
jgi:hypothetical protein